MRIDKNQPNLIQENLPYLAKIKVDVSRNSGPFSFAGEVLICRDNIKPCYILDTMPPSSGRWAMIHMF